MPVNDEEKEILEEQPLEKPKKPKAPKKSSSGSSTSTSTNTPSPNKSPYKKKPSKPPKPPFQAKGGYKKKGGAGGTRTGAGRKRKPVLNEQGKPKESLKKAAARSPEIKKEIYRFRRLQTRLNLMNQLNKTIADLSGNFKARENGLAKQSKLDYFRGKSGRISLETLRKFNKQLEYDLADVGLIRGTKSNRRINNKVLSNNEYFKRTLKQWLDERDFAGILFVNSKTDMEKAEEYAMENNYLIRDINDITQATNKVNITEIAKEADWLEIMYD